MCLRQKRDFLLLFISCYSRNIKTTTDFKYVVMKQPNSNNDAEMKQQN